MADGTTIRYNGSIIRWPNDATPWFNDTIVQRYVTTVQSFIIRPNGMIWMTRWSNDTMIRWYDAMVRLPNGMIGRFDYMADGPMLRYNGSIIRRNRSTILTTIWLHSSGRKAHRKSGNASGGILGKRKTFRWDFTKILSPGRKHDFTGLQYFCPGSDVA